MFNKKNRFWSLAATFFMGAAVGASVALLYAPMTGTKMKRKVAKAAENVKDAVGGSVDNVQSVLRKVVNA